MSQVALEGNNIVSITPAAAEALHAKTGDTLRIVPLSAQRRF